MDDKERLRLAEVALDSGLYDKETIEYIFPELKEESEDERIRQLLLRFVKYDMSDNYSDDFSKEDCLAWLEKQGGNNMGISEATKQKLEDNLNEALEKETPESCNEFLEKKGEQKPADKIEPKFKVGDWVVYNHRAYQVVELPKEGYIDLGLRGNGKIGFAPSTYCRHWTIQDAKDGDVLATDSWLYMFKYTNNKALIQFHCKCPINGTPYKWCYLSDDSYLDIYIDANIHPATKEQRELLFQKMKEAGYEWDTEKKELKKIENGFYYNDMGDYFPFTDQDNLVLIEQKPAWSEEDVVKINRIAACLENLNVADNDILLKDVDWLKSLKDRVQPQPKQEWSDKDEKMIHHIENAIKYDKSRTYLNSKGIEIIDVCNWLKSLRHQNRWKPSDEQMEMVDKIINALSKMQLFGGRNALIDLKHDLEKLREE